MIGLEIIDQIERLIELKRAASITQSGAGFSFRWKGTTFDVSMRRS